MVNSIVPLASNKVSWKQRALNALEKIGHADHPNLYSWIHAVFAFLGIILTRPVIVQSKCKHGDEILRRARDHYNDASLNLSNNELPALGNRWSVFADQLKSNIYTNQTLEQAIRWAQNWGNFDFREPITIYSRFKIQIAHNLMRNEYPNFQHLINEFPETPFSIATTRIKGLSSGAVSSVHYFHMFFVLTVLGFDKNISSVCEIGGGYGNPARLWLTNSISKIKYYCIVDLPESLFYAECFLRASLPNVKLVYVSDKNFAIPDLQEGEQLIILCPIQNHAITKSLKFDIIFNTGSMAEMTDEWVMFWSSWLDDQQASYFYSHNYFGNPVGKVYEALSSFVPKISGRWELKYLRPMHPLMQLHSERKATELIFAKDKTTHYEKGEISTVIKALLARKIDLYSFILFSYVFLKERNLLLEIDFIDRVIEDFGYPPVELIWILQKIIEHQEFNKLPEAAAKRVRELHMNISQQQSEGVASRTFWTQWGN